MLSKSIHILGMLFLLASCSAVNDSFMPIETLKEIEITPSAISVPLGRAQNFIAIAKYYDGSSSDISNQVNWEVVAGTGSATIGPTGVADTMGGAQGSVTVRANYQTLSNVATLTVAPPALVGIEVAPSTASTPKGLTQPFTATGIYSDHSTLDLTATATWSSTQSIANVNAGQAATTAVGSTEITASVSGVTSNVAALTVNPAALVSIAVAPSNASVAKGLTQTFTATGTYTDSSTSDLSATATWVSTQLSVATVSSGLASAQTTGSSTITASVGSIHSNGAALTVTAASLVSIAVTPTTASVAKGLTQPFTATGTYTDASTSDVTATATWAATPSSVATVNAGLASTLTTGSTGITATVGSVGSNSATLTVTAATLVSLAVTPANTSLALGTPQQYTATGTYTDNSTQDLSASVTWSRTNGTGSASISGSGMVTTAGGSQGTVTISASSGAINGQTGLTVLPLAAPNSLTVTTTSTSASVSWTMPVGSVASGYLLVKNTGGTVSFTPTNGSTYSPGAVSGGTILYVGSTASYLDSGLVGGTEYTYAVFAYDAANNYSAAVSGTYVIGCDGISGTFAGSGTSGDPYLICNASQLMQVNGFNLAADYLLVSDLDLSSYNGGSPATTVTLIGTYNNSTSSGTPFTGIFNGGSHTINNLYISQISSSLATGLFGYTSGATIENLTLTNVNITGIVSTGGVVGYAINTNLMNLTVTGTLTGYNTTPTSNGSLIGGIAGNIITNAGTIAWTNLSSTITISARDTLGGILGDVSVSGAGTTVTMTGITAAVNLASPPSSYGNTFGGILGICNVGSAGQLAISNVTVSGTIASQGSWVGGVAGTLQILAGGGTISFSNVSSSASVSTTGAMGTVTGNGNFYGAALGGAFGSMVCITGGTITMTQITATGSVTNNYSGAFVTGNAGGLIGINSPFGGTVTLAQSFSTGEVSIPQATYDNVGGLVGYLQAATGSGSATISNSYSLSPVDAPNGVNVGGFIGKNSNAVTTNSFADNSVTGNTNVGGFMGVNNASAGYVTSSYFNSSLNATGVASGSASNVTGLTTANFAIESNFTGWNFLTIWNDPSVIGYPTLQ